MTFLISGAAAVRWSMKRTGSRTGSIKLALPMPRSGRPEGWPRAHVPPRRPHSGGEGARRAEVAVRVDLERQLGQRSAGRTVDHGPAREGVKRRVVAGADQRVLGLDHREG